MRSDDFGVLESGPAEIGNDVSDQNIGNERAAAPADVDQRRVIVSVVWCGLDEGYQTELNY